jgi:hypothetical protein
MLKRIAGVLSRALFLGAAVLEDFSLPAPPAAEPDSLEPGAVDTIATELMTQDALDMVSVRIPRPPKLPSDPLVGSLEWRSRQRADTGVG